jgi:hypothetical protein
VATFNWPGFGIASVAATLDQPAQVNRSVYTGVRAVASIPWHGKWAFKVQLAVRQGDANFRAIRAFFTGLQGAINNFHLPAVEQSQNANSGVTLSSSASQGAISLVLTGVGTALVAGNMATIAGQLLSISSVGALSGTAQTINFQPALRAAAALGASVETAKPYALVALNGGSFSWDIAQWRQYGLMFEADEAIGDTDGASPAGDVWSGDPAVVVPANTVLPVITGSTVVGQTLTASTGTWSNLPTSYTYQWRRGGANIAGATTSTYVLVTADNTTNISVVVTATNANGSASATSAAVGPVSSSAYAGYALALPFKTASTDGYWVGGTNYAALSSVPGYSYSRSGQVGFLNSAATAVDYFAANVPPIEAGIGYEAYGALTNIIFPSATLTTQTTPTLTAAPYTLSIFGTGSVALSGAFTGTLAGTGTNNRVVLVFTPTAATLTLTVTGSVTTSGLLAGNFPDGGPIITTTTAAASVGDSLLTTTSPTLTNVDQLVWVTGSTNDLVNQDRFAQFHNDTDNERIDFIIGQSVAAKPRISIIAGAAGTSFDGAVAFTAGQVVTLFARRQGTDWRCGQVIAGALTWFAAASTIGVPAITKVTSGNYRNGAVATKGVVQLVAVDTGDFSLDATIISTVA